MTINNQKCDSGDGDSCISSADVAASFIAARAGSDTLSLPAYNLQRVGSASGSTSSSSDFSYIVGAAGTVVTLICLLALEYFFDSQYVNC